jgi:micrococcal nuclease
MRLSYRISAAIMKKQFSLYSLLLLILLPHLSFAWQGKVVGVSDGDTITVMHHGKEEKIRLYGVDCPEKRQDFGQKAKQFTASMVYGKEVNVEPIDTDRYGRTVGIIRTDGKCLNEELLKNGFAWLYSRYCHKPLCNTWYKYQEQARQKKIGLWSMANPVPPWGFRHGKNPSSISNNHSFHYYSVYHGNIKTNVFHRPSCKNYNCTTCTAIFNARDKAIAAGYRPMWLL